MPAEDRLTQSLDKLFHVFSALEAEDLERPWAWRDYDQDGLRFAFFRTYEELIELAAVLRAERASSNRPLTRAQRILSLYHQAFRQLECSLYGVSDEQAEFEPEPGEWSVRRTLAHTVTADLGFYTVVMLALEAAQNGGEGPKKPQESDWDRLVGIDDDEYDAVMAASLHEIRAFYSDWHRRILDDLSGIPDEKLGVPSRYWEGRTYPLQFRLLRFGSHLTQHSVQIEKTLEAVVGPPTEAKRLLRVLGGARAAIETARLSSPGLGAAHIAGMADALARRADEVEAVSKKPAGDPQ